MSQIGEEVIRMHREGVRSVDIAHRLNVALSTVHYHLRKLARPPDPKPPRSARPRTASSEIRIREEIAHRLAAGVSRAEIADSLGLSKSTVSYHAARLGAGIDARCRRRYDWAEVQAYYDEGNSVRDCVRAFGFSSASWHQAVKRGLVTARPGFRPPEEVFQANTHRHRGRLKDRLLSLGLKSNRCEQCGLVQWRERPISLALHHINGDRLDNRVENLELLCPNCHSQTDTFAGRNARRRALTNVPPPNGTSSPDVPSAA